MAHNRFMANNRNTRTLNGHTITNNDSKLSANDASDILGAIAIVQGGKPYGDGGMLHTDTCFSARQLKALDKLAAQLYVIAEPNNKPFPEDELLGGRLSTSPRPARAWRFGE